MNNGYFSGQYNPEELIGMDQTGGGGDGVMGMLGADQMQNSSNGGGQSLDEMVSQNAKELRRRSMPYFDNGVPGMDGRSRRISMMDFGGNPGNGNQMDPFGFAPTSASDMEALISGSEGMQGPNMGGDGSGNGMSLALNTEVANQAFNLAGPGSAYASPMHPNGNMDLDVTSPFINSAMASAMDMVDPSMVGLPTSDASAMQYYGPAPPPFHTADISSPMHSNFTGTPHQASTNSMTDRQPRHSEHNEGFGSGNTSIVPDTISSRPPSTSQSAHTSSRHTSQRSIPTQQTFQRKSGQATVALNPDPAHQMNVSDDPSNKIKVPWETPPGGFPSTMHGRPHMQTQYKDAYSSTGFDMLNVLMRVATRPNPEINIGSVDLSCAFVVTDAEIDDNPIVYCSENFERLTGYTKHMILGRNCRFLQSPDGNVESGKKRKYVDDDAVLYLKNTINERREAQISLINYRRGGQPFMNLLTMIPVRMDGPNIKFFVGFQVDLVEQPNAVTDKNPDGSYTINYQRAVSMPRYVLHPPDSQQHMDMGQTITRDDVSTVLSTIGTGESELSKRIWDRILLENTDDLVHVLSLKGLFLYLSPSCRKILEYDAHELVGTGLSSVCHPSDIVPVTRELKDTSSGTTVNVVFRIRRKNSGYMWFESHGSLHTEQGKGRKCIILVGRERPVYTVSKSAIATGGGIGDSELWSKMSTSGMFLFVSQNVRQLLDRQPEELVGTSIQALMRSDSKQEIARMLSIARTGKVASVQHEMMNKRGQVLKAFTTMYPGDATEGQKPTFVVAQTRLVRFQRGGSSALQRPSINPTQSDINGGSQTSGLSGASGLGSSTPRSTMSLSNYIPTDGTAITFAGQNGLALGRQDASLASAENLFDELKTTRSTSWQYELRQMERQNRLLAEEVQGLLAAKKKRKRRKGVGQLQKDCANCHTRTTPEWRRGPSGNRDLCNSCGLRWAKQNGRVSPRASSQPSAHSVHSDKASKASASPLHHQMSASDIVSVTVNPPASTVKQQSSPAHSHIHNVPPRIDESVEPD